MAYMNVGETIRQINRIRAEQTELYSNMDRFTTQAILTYMTNGKPTHVDEIFKLQERLTPTMTRKQCVSLLDNLVDSGYAQKVGREIYEPTSESFSRLEKEGITKEFLFPVIK